MFNKKNPFYYSLCLSLALTLMIFAAIPALGNIARGPWVQNVTTNSIYVLAECDTTATVTVKYGPTTLYGSTATTETIESTQAGENPIYYVHNVKLTGLTANTLYYYQVTQGSSTISKTFYSAVNPGTGFRLALMGDTRTGTTVHGTIASRIKVANPKISLYPGDLCNDYHTATWHNEFWVPNELALDASVPFYNAAGNHEGWKTNTFAFTHGSGTNKYYSFDYGDLHVLVLSNYDMGTDGYGYGSPQYNFALQDLQSSTKPWKIVVFHNPAYTYGSGHGGDPIMQTYTTNIFVPYGVTMCVAGHNHCYERICMSGQNGLRHITMGGGGAPLHSVSFGNGTEKCESTYCYGIIDITATTFNYYAYRSDGSLLDSLPLAKPSPTPTETPSITPPVSPKPTNTPTPTKTPTDTPSITPPPTITPTRTIVTGTPIKTNTYYTSTPSGPTLSPTKTPTPTLTNSTPTPTYSPGTSPSPGFSRVYEAETVIHDCGRAETDGWYCNTSLDAPGYMVRTPRATDMPPGPRTAKFRMMIDNNTGINDKVVNLEVYDATAGVILAKLDVYRFNFTANYTYQDFVVGFYNPVAGHMLEFRVWWYDTAYIKVDKITIN